MRARGGVASSPRLLNGSDAQASEKGRAGAPPPQAKAAQALTRSSSHDVINQSPQHFGVGMDPPSVYSGGDGQTPFDTPFRSGDSIPLRLSTARLPRPERKHFGPKTKSPCPRDLSFLARDTSPEVKRKEDTTRVQRRHYSPGRRNVTDTPGLPPQKCHRSPQDKGIPGLAHPSTRCGPPSLAAKAPSPISLLSRSRSADGPETKGHALSAAEILNPSPVKSEGNILKGAPGNFGRRNILQERFKEDAARTRWK